MRSLHLFGIGLPLAALLVVGAVALATPVFAGSVTTTFANTTDVVINDLEISFDSNTTGLAFVHNGPTTGTQFPNVTGMGTSTLRLSGANVGAPGQSTYTFTNNGGATPSTMWRGRKGAGQSRPRAGWKGPDHRRYEGPETRLWSRPGCPMAGWIERDQSPDPAGSPLDPSALCLSPSRLGSMAPFQSCDRRRFRCGDCSA